MTSSRTSAGARTAVTWGVIAVSAAGAVGAAALAYSEAAGPDATSTAAPGGNTWTTAPTTTSQIPGLNGAPPAQNRGAFTRSRGS